MKILHGTLLVATLILTIYLVFSLEKIIPPLKQNLIDSQKNTAYLQQQFTKQQETLALLQAEVISFRKETNDRIAKQEKYKDTIKSVRAALSKVQEAEAIHKTGNLNKAVDVLLLAKEPLWKAGDVFQSEQTAFRGLMTPIDEITSKWKSGNGTINTLQLSTTISAILEKLSNGL